METNPAQIVQPLLAPGERLLWSGEPRGPGARRMRRLVVRLLTVALVVIWAEGIRQFAIEGFSLTSYLAVAASLAGGGVWIVVRSTEPPAAGDVVYGLTDRRALVARRHIVRSVDLGTVAEMALIDAGAGRGTVVFGDPARISGPLRFEEIGQATKVYELARVTRERMPEMDHHDIVRAASA